MSLVINQFLKHFERTVDKETPILSFSLIVLLPQGDFNSFHGTNVQIGYSIIKFFPYRLATVYILGMQWSPKLPGGL